MADATPNMTVIVPVLIAVHVDHPSGPAGENVQKRINELLADRGITDALNAGLATNEWITHIHAGPCGAFSEDV